MSTQTIEQQLAASAAEVTRLNAEVTRLNAEVTRLAADLAAATQLAEEAQANLSAAQTRASVAEVERDAFRQQVADANDAAQTLRERVATLETNAATASERAAEIAARQCHIPADASPDGPAASGSIAEQFMAIKDPKAKAAFFKKNEKAILADQSLKA
jgi:phage shock protein A